MRKPLASLIIPAHNAERFLGQAIESAMSAIKQCPCEIIVVDDGSRDRTASIARSYSPPVKLIQKDNGGAASARNAGVLAAESDLVLLLDADDTALPDRVDMQVAYMLEHPEIDVTFGNIIVDRRPGLDYLRTAGLAPSGRFTRLWRPLQRLLCDGNVVPNSTAAIRRSTYLAAGMEREDVSFGEDYLMWCSIAGRGNFAYTTRSLAWYRRHKTSASNSGAAYKWMPLVLAEVLGRHAQALRPSEHRELLRRFQRSADMLCRHEWASSGRRAALESMRQHHGLIPRGQWMKWFLLTLVPGALPRGCRCVLRNCRGLGSAGC